MAMIGIKEPACLQFLHVVAWMKKIRLTWGQEPGEEFLKLCLIFPGNQLEFWKLLVAKALHGPGDCDDQEFSKSLEKFLGAGSGAMGTHIPYCLLKNGTTLEHHWWLSQFPNVSKPYESSNKKEPKVSCARQWNTSGKIDIEAPLPPLLGMIISPWVGILEPYSL